MAAGRACRAKGGLGWKVPTISGQDCGAGHDEDQIASIAASVAHIRSLVVGQHCPVSRPARPKKGPVDQAGRAWEFIGSRSRFRTCLPFPCHAWEAKASPVSLR